MEDKRKSAEYLVLLSRFLISCSDKCIRLSRDYHYKHYYNGDVLLQSEKDDPYFKIPKYQWHDQIVSELKIPVLNNDIPICVCPPRDIPPPTPISFKVAVYKPTRTKEFDHYQYEFVRMDER